VIDKGSIYKCTVCDTLFKNAGFCPDCGETLIKLTAQEVKDFLTLNA